MIVSRGRPLEADSFHHCCWRPAKFTVSDPRGAGQSVLRDLPRRHDHVLTHCQQSGRDMAMCTAPQHSLSTGHPPTVPAGTRPGEEPVQGPARHSRQHAPHPPLPRNVSVACLPIPTLNVVPSVGFHDRGLVPLLLHSERAITHRPRSTASASPVQNVAGSPRGCAKGRDQECDGLSPPLVNPRDGRPRDPRAVLESGDQDKERPGGGLGVLRPILSFWVIEAPWLAPGR